MNTDLDKDLVKEAAELVLKHKQATVSILQRYLLLGYNKASRLMDELERIKVVGKFEGTIIRKILIKDINDVDFS